MDGIIVATDDARIADACRQFGAEVAMTSSDHATGTDRIAEVASRLPHASHIINIQGDEPMIEPSLIDALAASLLADSSIAMATAANEMDDPHLFSDPNVVKVVMRADGDALYFSRSPIPFLRNTLPSLKLYRHKGIYAYRADFLRDFVSWPPSPLEQAESLEQLRALENGARIRVLITDDTSGGIDTLEQAIALENYLQSQR